MKTDNTNQGRRRFLTAATTVIGGVGAAFTAVPFISSWQPSAKARAIGAPVEVDISKLEPGQRLTVTWRGKPVWIVRRTQESLDALELLGDKLRDPGSEVKTQQPKYALNTYRAIKPEYLVLVGICTHLGCSPSFVKETDPHSLGPEWKGGFFCPCHGSRFDLAGRVFQSVPAPTNLVVPPHAYLSDSRILVGVDQDSIDVKQQTIQAADNLMKNLLNGLLGWTDARFPLTKMWKEHVSEYYAPKNLNFWYFFGSLAILVLVNQILTGIWLTMSYKPDAELAFASVEFIMRDVEWGWLIRYLHSTGASAFFVVIYLHMFRGLIYGSHKRPRELLWLIGMLIYLMLMAEAFMGYLLPWGQMSYWGAQVIVSLFGAIPVVGEDLTLWIRGDYVVSDATLNRFFALHVIALPIALLGLIVVHIMALHEVGSNNPDGIEIKKNKNDQGIPVDGIPFHPYYTVKDMVGAVVFLFLFSMVVFFWPEMGGWFLEKDNFVPANPLKTPEHIVPLWYFTPFYAILRAIPDKLIGVLAMGASIVVLFLLPWLDQHPIKSIRYRSLLFKLLIAVFVVTFVILGWLGTQPAVPVLSELGMRFAELYFSFFLILWLYSKERPSSVHFGVFVAVLAVVLFVDVFRFSSDNIALILVSSLIAIAYFLVFILGPVFNPALNESKSVPDRLVK